MDADDGNEPRNEIHISSRAIITRSKLIRIISINFGQEMDKMISCSVSSPLCIYILYRLILLSVSLQKCRRLSRTLARLLGNAAPREGGDATRQVIANQKRVNDFNMRHNK